MCARKMMFMLSIGLIAKQFVIKEGEGMQSISKPAPSYSLSLSSRISWGVCRVTGIKRSEPNELKAACITNKGLKMPWFHWHDICRWNINRLNNKSNTLFSVTFNPNVSQW